MLATDSFFPIQTEMRDSAQTLYANTVVGGVSKREYFALTIFCAFSANPALVATGMTTNKLRGIAIDQADKLLADLAAPPTEARAENDSRN